MQARILARGRERTKGAADNDPFATLTIWLESVPRNRLENENEEVLRVNAWEIARSQRMAGQYFQYQQGYLDEAAYRAI